MLTYFILFSDVSLSLRYYFLFDCKFLWLYYVMAGYSKNMKHSFLHLGAFCFEKGRPRATVPQINLNFCSVLKIQVN
jgi:hypothetical protein